MRLRTMRGALWCAAGASLVLALSASCASSDLERDPGPDPESAGEPAAVRAVEEPGETIDRPTEFSAAVFEPVEFIDIDAIAAELWPETPSREQRGVTFVAVDVASADPGVLENPTGEAGATTNFDAWDRAHPPDVPEFDEFDFATVPEPGPDA